MLNCFTVDEAARELGCTVRTVWRDLAVLQKANFPLYDDKAGRIFRGGGDLPDHQLHDVALLVDHLLAEDQPGPRHHWS